jgi:ABC-type bacteriocin/lantibiotic exporter with double-glycine peptidase domain
MKLYQLEAFFADQFAEIVLYLRDSQYKNQWKSIKPKLFIDTIPFISFPSILLIVFSGVLIFPKYTVSTIKIENLLFVFVFLQKIIPLVSQFITSLVLMQSSQGMLNDYIKLVGNRHASVPLRTVNSFEAKLDVVEVDHLNYSFDKTCIVNDFSGRFQKGDVVLVSGDSGVGKSTFIDIITGLIKTTDGCVKYYSKENQSLSTSRDSFTIVSQNDFFINGSVLDNILLGKDGDIIDYDRLFESCRIAGLDKFLECTIAGLSISMGENGHLFSGGQRQRVGIARGLYRNSDVLVFDESFTGLDHKSSEEIIARIVSYRKDQILFFISHDIGFNKRIVNKILYFNQGGKLFISEN